MNYMTALIQLPLVKEEQGKRIITPEEVYGVCKDLSTLAQEAFHVLLLNTKNNLINRQMVTLGLLDASLVHPREVLRPAIVENAAALILVHNHPSGDATPSAEDIRITKQLVAAAKTVDINVLDHVIVGRARDGEPGWYSIREAGLCDFES